MSKEVLGRSVYPEFFKARTRLDKIRARLDQQVSELVNEAFGIARTTMPFYTTSSNDLSRLPSSTDRVGRHSYFIRTVDDEDQIVFLLLRGDPYSMIIVDQYKDHATVDPEGQVLGELSRTTFFARRAGGLNFVAYTLPEDQKSQHCGFYNHSIDFREKVTRGYGCSGTLGLITLEVTNSGVDYARPGYETSVDPVANGLAVLSMLKRGSALKRITLDSLPHLGQVCFVDQLTG